MASRAVNAKRDQIKIYLADGSIFACSSCGRSGFRVVEDDIPMHLFCWCGQIYTEKDLPPLKESPDA